MVRRRRQSPLIEGGVDVGGRVEELVGGKHLVYGAQRGREGEAVGSTGERLRRRLGLRHWRQTTRSRPLPTAGGQRMIAALVNGRGEY